MRLYLDANAIVFVVEGPARLRDVVAEWLDKVESDPTGVTCTSRLSLTECYTKSLRAKNETKFREMDRFFLMRVESKFSAWTTDWSTSLRIFKESFPSRRSTPFTSRPRSELTPTFF